MVNDLLGVMVLSAILLSVVFIILILIWAFKPAHKNDNVKSRVKGDLKKIKDQINGDD